MLLINAIIPPIIPYCDFGLGLSGGRDGTATKNAGTTSRELGRPRLPDPKNAAEQARGVRKRGMRVRETVTRALLLVTSASLLGTSALTRGGENWKILLLVASSY